MKAVLAFYMYLIFVVLAADDVKNKLVLYYKFNEGSGNYIKDYSGCGNDANVYNARYVLDGDGSALEFNGPDNYVDCGNSKSLNDLHREITISLWLKKNKETVPGMYRLVSQKSYYNDYEGYYLGCRGNDASFEFIGSGETVVGGKYSKNYENWTHVSATVTDTGTAMIGRIYVNGTKIAESHVEACLPGVNNLFLGCNTPGNGFYYGRMDELRIYNYALPESEIKKIYSQDLTKINKVKDDIISQLPNGEGVLSFGKHECYIKLPDNYNPEKKSPLILFFHGRGGSAKKNNFNTQPFTEFRKKAAARGYVVAVPGYGSDCWFNDDAEKITIEMLDFLGKNISCDTERFFVMGCSMGGASALIFSARHPEKVKAVCDVFGITDFTRFYNEGFYNASISKAYAGSPSERPVYYRDHSAIDLTGSYAGIPFLVLHGDRDTCVPKWNSDILVKKMRQENISVKYIQVKNIGHDNAIVINQEDNILDFFDSVKEKLSSVGNTGY